eukprot:CAMPEP_0197644520 /NCGR_PEP_ID=MMETSP1338-20131121/17466_1 /TAXON_ID=43686 ORGANISM="Pelagodinium beii, Strain RCC1491" /NCGR_SAMPLE_ID=MMETSP1338 /ASSEMBLY_ACC=CAM_ASM_000754 /LENGTH=305 /DNA_ID=CAMNT_0043217929 /DNA_START=83 /DNA_END=1000 /DNA_ORIENTATION=-
MAMREMAFLVACCSLSITANAGRFEVYRDASYHEGEAERMKTCTKEASYFENLAEYLESKLNKVKKKGTSGIMGRKRILKLVYKTQKLSASMARMSLNGCNTTDSDAHESLSNSEKILEMLLGSHLGTVKDAAEVGNASVARSLTRLIASFNKTAMTQEEEASIASKLESEGHQTELLAAIDGAVRDTSDGAALVEATSSFLQTEDRFVPILDEIFFCLYGLIWFVVTSAVQLVYLAVSVVVAVLAAIICFLSFLVNAFLAFIGLVSDVLDIGECIDLNAREPIFALYQVGRELTQATNPFDFGT